MINHGIKKGLTGKYTIKTTNGDAYSASYNGALNYLVSSTAIINMFIEASTDMLDKLLPPDFITVGKKIEINHEHPSLIGETIILNLVVDHVDGHSVVLKIEAYDSKGRVCSGSYERVFINQGKLLDIAYHRAPDLL